MARAEGNAFFVEELVGASRNNPAPGGLPDDLADLLLVRLDRLDDAGRQVVRAASCAGRRVTHALLAAVVDLSDDELDAALRAAVESHVLVQVGADGYAFRHALLAEAVVRRPAAGRAGPAAREVRRGAARPGSSPAPPPSWRPTPGPPTTSRPRSGPAMRAGEEAMAVGGPDDAASALRGAALELLARPSAVAPRGRRPRRARHAHQRGGHRDRPRRPGDAARAGAPGPAGRPAADRDRARLLLAWAAAALVSESRDGSHPGHGRRRLQLIGDEPGRLRTRALSLHARALAAAGP